MNGVKSLVGGEGGGGRGGWRVRGNLPCKVTQASSTEFS